MIHVEEMYFEESELIRANSMEGGYEDFMILSTESPTRYMDFTTVNNTYFGDTDKYEDVLLTQKDFDEGSAMTHSIGPDIKEKFINDSKTELEKSIGVDGTGYIYVCQREDDDFAIGICISTQPLKKATTEEWESL